MIIKRSGRKIPRKALERFKANTLKRDPADRTFAAMDEVIASLNRRKRR